MLSLIPMNAEELRIIYDRRMKKDFPPLELKSWDTLENQIHLGIYQSNLLLDHGKPIGYALLVKVPDEAMMLLDYFAIFEEYRSDGYGSRGLRLLSEAFGDEANVLIEIEAPLTADDPASMEERIRRLNFYARNGVVQTNVSLLCVGVTYDVLVLPRDSDNPPSDEQVLLAMTHLYRYQLRVTDIYAEISIQVG